MIAEAKSNATIVVWETKIRLAEDVANAGSWDLTGWRESLAKLTSKLMNTSQDPKEQPSKVEEVENVTGDDNQLMG